MLSVHIVLSLPRPLLPFILPLYTLYSVQKHRFDVVYFSFLMAGDLEVTVATVPHQFRSLIVQWVFCYFQSVLELGGCRLPLHDKKEKQAKKPTNITPTLHD